MKVDDDQRINAWIKVYASPGEEYDVVRWVFQRMIMTCPRLEDVKVYNSQQSVEYGNKFRWSAASAGSGEDDGSQAKRMHSLSLNASRRTCRTTEAGTPAQQALWG